MPQKQYFFTSEELARREKELEHLHTVRRPEVAEKIRRSKEMGGTDHNAEYEDAKNEQAFVEGHILEKKPRSATFLEQLVDLIGPLQPEGKGL